MAKCTMELREILNRSNLTIGLQNYPVYEFTKVDYSKIYENMVDYQGHPITNLREHINNRFIKHFYFREIGLETPEMFIFKLNDVMEKKMPYYNQMFASLDQEWNPLWNMDLTETFTHEVTDNGNTGTSNTSKITNEGNENSEQNTNTQNDINSNNNTTRTPNILNEVLNTKLNTGQNGMTDTDMKNRNYMSEGEYNKDTQSGTDQTLSTGTQHDEGNSKVTNDINSNSEQNTTSSGSINSNNNRLETYTRKQEGSTAGFHAPIALKQWRDNMINVEMMILDDEDLNDLFINVF